MNLANLDRLADDRSVVLYLDGLTGIGQLAFQRFYIAGDKAVFHKFEIGGDW